MNGSVKVEGLRALERKLHQLGDLPAVRRAGRKALRAGGAPMVASAKQFAPDDPVTGPDLHLRASIKMATGRRERGDDGDQVWVVIGIDANVDPPVLRRRKDGRGSYRDPGVAGVASIIEFGRAGVPAAPFFRPAWDAHKAGATAIVGRALGPAIETEAAKLAARG